MAKMGRHLKYETPELLEKDAMKVLNECSFDDGPVPTIAWLEFKLGIDFYTYANRPRFRDTCNRLKKIAFALYEQKANRGLIVPQIAKLKLSHHPEYAPVVTEMEVRHEATIDNKLFASLFDKANALDIESKSLLIDNLNKVVGDEEGDDDS